MFNENDIKKIEAHGITLATVEQQIENFKKGFPYLSIVRAASCGDGIISYTAQECQQMLESYDSLINNKKIVKFVPASGAATRMFKAVYEFVDQDKPNKGLDSLIEQIEECAFYSDLAKCINEGATAKQIANGIISKEGLNYGALPKGVLKFHKYGQESHTPCQEHLIEGALYGVSQNSSVNLHFTVSSEFEDNFKTIVDEITPSLEAKYGVKFDVSFSNQLSSTDTIAVTMDNEPFRNEDGSLLFRPAGHGALIMNLNSIDADMIFIKNIDNVVHCDHIEDTVTYKKVLATTLLNLQNRVFELLKELESGSEEAMDNAATFISDKLGVTLPEFRCFDMKLEFLIGYLNRPIRVAGMVKNEGEPGGGPFWCSSENGVESLQIAESSQISPSQIDLMKTASHFNPVDIVCSTKDYRGDKFDLTQYVDYNCGFISEKSKDGKALKAQELPGLWNGAMANWITLFVETPISTFNPVKEVADLIKPLHKQA
ncbi:MAG: DUF4301 family protein [Rikenellaceae bacterium]